MAEEDSGFRVADRRKFTEDGELRDSAQEASTEAAVPSGASGAAQGGEKKVAESTAPPIVGQESRNPKMDFRTLVLSLSTTAFFQMGLAPNPASQKVEKDLPGARQTIEILEILQDKTQGNLRAEETRLLDQCLHDLKMSFVQSSRNVTLG
jgi:hypothetical protein